MKNSVVPRQRSKLLPSLQSAKRQMSNVEKNEPCDRQVDPVKRVSRTVDKFRVGRNTEGNVADRLVRETSGQKEVTGRERNLRSMTIPSYDIDGMTVEELHASLHKITENARQPFSFLADISKEFARDDYHLSTKAKEPTDIDIQLASVAKRIESCKLLIEKTKSCVKDTRDRVNPHNIARSSDA